MVTGKVAKLTVLPAAVILIAVLAAFIAWHHSGKAEATGTLTVGLDAKVNQADAGTYSSTLPTFEKCVDVKTAANDPITPNGIFYFDAFVLNTNQLAADQIDFTISNSGMHILQIDPHQFFGAGSGVSAYVGGASLDANGNITSPAGGISNGDFEATIVDTGGAHTGSGVMMRFKAQGNIVGGGVVINFSFNNNQGGTPGRGIVLTDNAAAHPGDTNGNGFFDGPVTNTTIKIAVDRPDSDGDGVSNDCDNCPSNSNANQADIDGDGLGDVCDSDKDGDGIANGSDTCPTVYDPTNNPNSCLDTDGDGIFDGLDNCPSISNANQANNDGDAQGDVCDPDDDNDGVLDGPDNCDFAANPTQADFNSNGVGDACEDSDADGWIDASDNCPGLANQSQVNNDSDNYGNICDNCPNTSNNTQADWNSNFIGDACDDTDLDTWMDSKEIYVLTNKSLKCPADNVRNNEAVDAWPPDMDDNRLINLQDIGVFNSVFGLLVTHAPVNVPGLGVTDVHRFDLNISGNINLQDIGQYNPIFGHICTP